MVKSKLKNLSTAKAIATRRNNKARKRLAAERASLPLFADQLPTDTDLPVITPEQVIAEREQAAEEWSERRAEIEALIERHHVERVAWIKTQVSDAEFRDIQSKAAACDFGESSGARNLSVRRHA